MQVAQGSRNMEKDASGIADDPVINRATNRGWWLVGLIACENFSKCKAGKSPLSVGSHSKEIPKEIHYFYGNQERGVMFNVHSIRISK